MLGVIGTKILKGKKVVRGGGKKEKSETP